MSASRADLVLTLRPRLGGGCQQMGELPLRQIGAAPKRFALRREQARHRPAAVAGHRCGRLHVDGIDVGPLLAVHLDPHEARVHLPGDLTVFEGFVGHHVAPMTRRIPDRQQDRHVALPRLCEGLRSPRPPVHRVVRMLQQIGGRRTPQPIAHSSLPRCSDVSAVCLITSVQRFEVYGGKAYVVRPQPSAAHLSPPAAVPPG